MTPFISYSSTLYRHLLWLCPEELRRDFRAEMILVFSEDLADSWIQSGLLGAFHVWRRAACELLQIGLSRAVTTPEFIVPALSCGLSAVCLGGELMLVRSLASPEAGTPALAEAIRMVVLWPSLTAAFVSFTAVRLSARCANLSLFGRPTE